MRDTHTCQSALSTYLILFGQNGTFTILLTLLLIRRIFKYPATRLRIRRRASSLSLEAIIFKRWFHQNPLKRWNHLRVLLDNCFNCQSKHYTGGNIFKICEDGGATTWRNLQVPREVCHNPFSKESWRGCLLFLVSLTTKHDYTVSSFMLRRTLVKDDNRYHHIGV